MFIDKAEITIQAGDGGNGAVSFRHEKFVDRGGPDGGDGGNGGDIVFVASWNQNTLSAFRYNKLLVAEFGQAGSKQKKHGKAGKNLEIKVPVGTVVYNKSGELLADLILDNQIEKIASGGKGGFGNAHFVSSKRQAPRVAEKGEEGEKLEVVLELKIIADIGLVGLPNAGKSTLLARISNAKPEIANYPFTTLNPNLGVVDIDKSTSLLFADIPGLIEGASEGKGLGDEFLRHIERTKVLVHLVDIYNSDIVQAYRTIQNELSSYKIDLSKKPQIVAITKTEGMDSEIIDDAVKTLAKIAGKKSQVLAISAQSGTGLKELLFAVKAQSKDVKVKIARKSAKKTLPIITLPKDDKSWVITQTEQGFTVTGRKIENFAKKTDFDNPEGVRRLRDIMKKMGITYELRRKKIDAGQKITIGKPKIGDIEY